MKKYFYCKLSEKCTLDNTDVLDTDIEIINKKTISHPITIKEKTILEDNDEGGQAKEVAAEPIKEEKEGFEQISIFDDLDD